MSFLKKSAAALVLGAVSFGAVGVKAEEVTIRAIAAFPKPVAFTQSFLGYVNKVNEMGKGVIQIKHAGGPEIVPPPQQADAARRGVVDMVYGPATYYLGKMPEADAWVGSTITAPEARKNGGFALMQQAFDERLGVHLLGHLDSGVKFYIYTTKEPKMTSDGDVDLSGLKIRAQPIYKTFFESRGIVPVSIATPETYTALERNTIDGAGWPIVAVEDLGWTRFLKYRIDPGFFQTDLAVMMNKKALAKLSPAARKVLEDAMVAYEQESLDNMLATIEKTDASTQAKGLKVITLEGAKGKAYLDKAYGEAWGRLQASGSPLYEKLKAAYYTR